MANKKQLTQTEKDAIQVKQDELIASWQKQPGGVDNLTFSKVRAWVLLLIELEGYQKKDK